MRFRTLLTAVVAVLLAAFLIVNWRLFAAPAHLSLLVADLDAPTGVVMLALFLAALAVLWGYVGVWQGTLLAEFRRQGKELQAQRALAESAETSRFTELAALMREEIANSSKRVEAAVEALRAELQATENSLAATLGEMDDRYRRSADRQAG